MYLNDIEGGMFQLPAFTEFYGTGLGIECIIIGCSTCLKLQHIILVGAGVYGYRMKRIFFFLYSNIKVKLPRLRRSAKNNPR